MFDDWLASNLCDYRGDTITVETDIAHLRSVEGRLVTVQPAYLALASALDALYAEADIDTVTSETKRQVCALLASTGEAVAGEQAAQGEACELCGGSGRYVRAIAYEDADGTVREDVSNILCHGCNGTGKRQSHRAREGESDD